MQGGGTGGPCPARDVWTLSFDPASTSPSGSWEQGSYGPNGRTEGALTLLPSTWMTQPIDLQGQGRKAVMLSGGFEQSKQVRAHP
jgi:hypothetical protein